jgi:hypothetical protein
MGYYPCVVSFSNTCDFTSVNCLELLVESLDTEEKKWCRVKTQVEDIPKIRGPRLLDNN